MTTQPTPTGSEDPTPDEAPAGPLEVDYRLSMDIAESLYWTVRYNGDPIHEDTFDAMLKRGEWVRKRLLLLGYTITKEQS